MGTGPLGRVGPGPGLSEQTGLGEAGLQPAEQRRCSERGSAGGTTMNVQGFTGGTPCFLIVLEEPPPFPGARAARPLRQEL